MRLLIVEDDPLVGPATQAVLKQVGHHVAGVATTPVKANRLARRARVAVAITDLKPADGGRGLTPRGSSGRGSQCLIITDYQPRAYEVRKTALGILHKPFSPAALIKVVAVVGELLAGRSPRCSIAD